jgi:anthranilate phosphoribosyltransferase
MNEKSNRGGKRENAGRKQQPYKTITIAFRVRVEHAEEIKEIVKQYQEQHATTPTHEH